MINNIRTLLCLHLNLSNRPLPKLAYPYCHPHLLDRCLGYLRPINDDSAAAWASVSNSRQHRAIDKLSWPSKHEITFRAAGPPWPAAKGNYARFAAISVAGLLPREMSVLLFILLRLVDTIDPDQPECFLLDSRSPPKVFPPRGGVQK